MLLNVPAKGLPQILISASDHARLTALAESAARRGADAADRLLFELDRAVVLDSEALPQGIVRMGSKVTYRDENRGARTVTLVYPADANIDDMRISVLTPIGAALIGMQAGQSIEWSDPSGHRRMLTVVDAC